MVCPYCGTRNGTNAPICGQCGAILRDSLNVKAGAFHKKTAGFRFPQIERGSLAVAITAPVVAFVIGYFLGGVASDDNKKYELIFALTAAVVSVVVILAVSFGRITLLRLIYGTARRKLSNEVQRLITAAEENVEKLLEENNSGEYRFQLASIFLLMNDLEKSIHQFEQAQQLQFPGRPQDLNNLAVALAMRGQIGPAYERLDRAATVSPMSAQPKFNLARILNHTGRDVDAKLAEQKLMESSKLLENNSDLICQLGMANITEGRYEEAIKYFERAASLYNKAKDRDGLLTARNNIALAFAADNRLAEAQAELTGIIKAEPENARAIANLGVLLIEKRKYAEAIDRLQRAVQIDPNLASAHCNLGYAYAMTGAINEGIREFRAAVLLDANHFEAQYNLGKSYLDEGILDVAEKSLLRAVQLRKTSWHVHTALGVLYYRRGLFEKAISAFNDSLSLSPLESVTLSGLAVTYVQRGYSESAFEKLKLAQAHDQQNAEILTNLSWIEISNTEYNEASDLAKKAIAADLALAEPNNNLGLCQLALGAPEVAMDAFKRALTLDPSQIRLHHHLACTHIALKQIDNAVREWKEASQLEPGNGDVYSNLGVALYRLGRTEDAIVEFRRVLKVRTDRKEDYINLGLALASAKHHKEAIEQFDKALALDPRNAVVHSNRGLACYFANNVDEALREWQLVTQLDPAYAKRRGKKQESEYDDAIIEYTALNTKNRAFSIEPHTAGFLYRYLPGYETDKWMVVAPLTELEPVRPLQCQIAKFDRQLRGLDMK